MLPFSLAFSSMQLCEPGASIKDHILIHKTSEGWPQVTVSGELQGPRGCCPESALELGLASQVACHPVTSSARVVVRSSDSKAGSLGLLLHSGGAVGARPRRALSC